MIKYFGNQLVDLFYRLWNGVEKSSGKAEASYTEEFSFEEDMPATSFLLMSEEKASKTNLNNRIQAEIIPEMFGNG